jgi:hypothetical protein
MRSDTSSCFESEAEAMVYSQKDEGSEEKNSNAIPDAYAFEPRFDILQEADRDQ